MILRAVWRQEITISVYSASRSLPVKSCHEMFFRWVFNDKENSLWFKTNLFLFLNFYSGPPSTDSWSFWSGIVLFFFFLSPRRLQSHPAKRNQQTSSASQYMDSDTLANDWVQVPSHIQQWHFSCCILKPTQERQSVWVWLVNTQLVKNVFCNT